MCQAETIRIGVIMAGGSGERFWPLSRLRRPKQLLKLTNPRQTMLGEALARLAPEIPPERIYVVTGEHLLEPIRATSLGLPHENVIAEPCKRNTSGALVFAAAHVLATLGGDGSGITMAVTTADHLIRDEARFQDAIKTAMEAAERENVLATIGVVPTRTETAYGYIQVDPAMTAVAGFDRGVPVYQVRAFHEKPNREMAEDFIATGHYFWNSGMFFWKLSTFLDELRYARPQLAQAATEMVHALTTNDQVRLRAIFESLEDVSIDYALMEHARHVLMVRGDFGWDDVGSWPALDRTFDRDAQGNVAIGDPVLVDVEDCIVYNAGGAEKVAVGVIGCEDLVVVVTDDAVLVMPKDRAQDVRQVVAKLKAGGAKQV